MCFTVTCMFAIWGLRRVSQLSGRGMHNRKQSQPLCLLFEHTQFRYSWWDLYRRMRLQNEMTL